MDRSYFAFLLWTILNATICIFVVVYEWMPAHLNIVYQLISLSGLIVHLSTIVICSILWNKADVLGKHLLRFACVLGTLGSSAAVVSYLFMCNIDIQLFLIAPLLSTWVCFQFVASCVILFVKGCRTSAGCCFSELDQSVENNTRNAENIKTSGFATPSPYSSAEPSKVNSGAYIYDTECATPVSKSKHSESLSRAPQYLGNVIYTDSELMISPSSSSSSQVFKFPGSTTHFVKWNGCALCKERKIVQMANSKLRPATLLCGHSYHFQCYENAVKKYRQSKKELFTCPQCVDVLVIETI